MARVNAIHVAIDELIRRAERDSGQRETTGFDRLAAGLHPRQRAFYDDESKRKAALAGRRGGKSEGLAAWLFKGHEQVVGESSLFIARTAGHARRILWPTLQRIDQRFRLGLKFREDIHTIRAPNGYEIHLVGSDTWRDVEKLRGPRYFKVAIDEAGSFPPDLLRYLVQDILDPALMDLDGELGMVGSPGVVPNGFFYERTTGDGAPRWPTHVWNCLDNPYVRGREYLERKLRENGWDENHPTYVREYLGHWVKDEGALVYPYDGERNAFLELPEGELTWALAVDLGAGERETTSFALGATLRSQPNVYVRKVEKHARMIPTRIAAEIDRYRSEYPIRYITVDAGALGVGYVGELRERYGIACEPAKKSDRRAYQEIVAGELKSGQILIHPYDCRDLLDEIMVLQWNEKREHEAEGQPNHAADSFLYLCRALRPYYKPQEEPPKEGSPEWWAAEQAREREIVRKRSEETRRRMLKGASLKNWRQAIK